MNEWYPKDWVRVVLMVSPSGECHAIGGDQPPGDGDQPFYGLERIAQRRSKQIEALTRALRDAVSVYSDKDATVTEERIEAWKAALDNLKP